MAPDLLARIAILEKVLKKLNRIRRREIPEQKFLEDDDLQDIVERNLQVAVEALIDVGNHIIGKKNYRKPETAADTFQVLAEEGLLEEDFARKLQGWVGLRNVIVHIYADINISLLYKALMTEQEDLREAATILCALVGGDLL